MEAPKVTRLDHNLSGKQCCRARNSKGKHTFFFFSNRVQLTAMAHARLLYFLLLLEIRPFITFLFLILISFIRSYEVQRLTKEAQYWDD